MQAVMETLEPIWPAAQLEFRTQDQGRVQGQIWGTQGRVFKFWASLYADDAGLVVGSRQELEACVPVLHAHLKRFGMLMHVGSAAKKSKTEAMFVPLSVVDGHMKQRENPCSSWNNETTAIAKYTSVTVSNKVHLPNCDRSGSVYKKGIDDD